jgi:hypothetical protein
MNQDAFDLACHEMAPVYAERDRLRNPYHAEMKCEQHSSITVETDCDGMVCLFIHKPGSFMGMYLTAAQAGELESALYRAREHVGGC